MTRMPVRIAMLLAATLAAWQPSKARAAEEDVQLWQIAIVTGDLAKDTALTVDVSQRWRETARGGDQQTFRFSIDQRVAEGVRIGGGAAVFEAGGSTELRPHQQITIVRGGFESRTRFEQRFFDGADRAELRLRQRIQYTHPLGKGWRASVGGEVLGLLQGRNAGDGASTDQWRAQVRIMHAVNDRLEVAASYWLIGFPRGDRPDRYTHVPQTVVTWRF
ncbi:DUF2490 domain-containing protein [Porphyrobacter sp. CACIAM 03H1]|uniref:DUF2490 domain-containing protein n=1 Tax=Porphyrobacter sp. CACIAM 03H1 TaxID=2003315 RepID=UPI000B5A7B7E|nr:DUF2490 domain-containing protein [Porphyrobacter sp. CACIAM 03H1]ASJ91804.1 hypothetical protein CBR61_13330 [Porphyrobacter sp. CACIAM 03H1]